MKADILADKAKLAGFYKDKKTRDFITRRHKTYKRKCKRQKGALLIITNS